MFEQEASEYAKPFHDMTRYDYVEERTHVKEAFQKGAEFGYNKAMNEQGYKVASAYDEGVAVGRDRTKTELTKAKEIIKELLGVLPKENIEGIYEATEEAEHFLKEA